MVQQRLVRDFYNILDQVNTEEIPPDLELPNSFSQLVSEMKTNQYDAKTFAVMLKAMVCNIPLTLHCVSVQRYNFVYVSFLNICVSQQSPFLLLCRWKNLKKK